MQAGSLQVREAHAGAAVFQILVQLVEVKQVVILTVSQRVHAVAHCPVRNRGQPGVVVGSVDALVGVGHLLGQFSVLVPGHVVGGVFHAGGIKQVLVVEQHPEVAAERNGVLHAVHRIVHFRAAEAGHVIIRSVQRGRKALGLPVDQVVNFLDHDDVALVAAFQHGGRLHGVVLGSNVDVFNGHARVGGFKGILLGNQVGGGGGVPGHHGDHLVFFRHGGDGQQHHHGCQQQGQHFLHGGSSSVLMSGKCYRFHSSRRTLPRSWTILPRYFPVFVFILWF